jgi:hypothetical protein
MHALQAISTKYLPATNTLSSRIKATSSSGLFVTIGYPHELSGVDCHALAAEKLARKLDWLAPGESFESRYIAGGTFAGYVFIQKQ